MNILPSLKPSPLSVPRPLPKTKFHKNNFGRHLMEINQIHFIHWVLSCTTKLENLSPSRVSETPPKTKFHKNSFEDILLGALKYKHMYQPTNWIQLVYWENELIKILLENNTYEMEVPNSRGFVKYLDYQVYYYPHLDRPLCLRNPIHFCWKGGCE